MNKLITAVKSVSSESFTLEVTRGDERLPDITVKRNEYGWSWEVNEWLSTKEHHDMGDLIDALAHKYWYDPDNTTLIFKEED